MIAATRSRMFFTMNIALLFILVGMVLSFFIFSFERGNSRGFFAYGQSKERVQMSDAEALKGAVAVQQVFRKIARENMAAVVNISTETVVEVRNPYSDFFGDDFFREFFGGGGGPGPSMKQKQRSLGSGFIVDDDGYMLSNLHVVKNATKITIRLYNESKDYEAKIIGTDESSDLALLKIEGKGRKFPAVKLGDSDEVELGDYAIAIGNPFGLNNTMTTGTVSSKARNDVSMANKFQRFIQIDVPINPGNSGGPLFNIYGEVIGVNSMIFSTSGGNIGIGFAIPINLAKKIMGQLREKGKVTRGWLGVYFQDIDEKLAKSLGVGEDNGVYVSSVIKESPAEKAGMNEGDIITDVDGKAIKRTGDLYGIVTELPVGKTVSVKLIRDGKALSMNVKIAERPEESKLAASSGGNGGGTEASNDRIGITVSDITADIARELRLRPDDKGVVITKVKPRSPAAEAGLQPGDIIRKIDRRAISGVKDYEAAVKEVKKSYLLLVKRGLITAAVNVELDQK
ncbi:MAG: Do family serine endopeptidase [Spirochaetota bacterium]